MPAVRSTNAPIARVPIPAAVATVFDETRPPGDEIEPLVDEITPLVDKISPLPDEIELRRRGLRYRHLRSEGKHNRKVLFGHSIQATARK